MAQPSVHIHGTTRGKGRYSTRTWVLVAVLMLAGCASLPEHVKRPVSHALENPAGTTLGQLANQKRPSQVNDARSGLALLASPNAAFAGRLALTQDASKTLDIQYYSIHLDPTVISLLAAIRQAAQRGVRVRILLDDFNSVGHDAQVMQMAGVPGIEMRMFNPLPGNRGSGLVRALTSLHDFKRIQHRMHNKAYIADNAWGIIGGRNLGDRYFGTAEGEDFIDMDVLAAGPVVRGLSASFDRYWNNPLAYPVESLITPKALKQLHNATAPTPDDTTQKQPLDGSTKQPANPAVAPSATGDALLVEADAKQPPPLPAALDLKKLPLTWAAAGLLVDSPLKLLPDDAQDTPEDTVIDGLLSLLSTAQHDVLIVSPYFVPGEEMMAVFTTLKKRGVRVQVLTNSLASTDALLAQIGYARHRKALLKSGLELYEVKAHERAQVRDTMLGSQSSGSRASLHAKLVIVDDRVIGIGSMNLDLRSKLQNTEIALVIRSPSLARQAAKQVHDVIHAGAWKLSLTRDGRVQWHALPQDQQPVLDHDPDTSAWLRFLAKLLSPLTPDEML
ncbi:phospholipase D family protein [Castellaniella sp.]|jgi:phosphatidylserine/phosphatidylglycerophosphate/cardiolipin synthase-like enzyme|uniref:phospholipase D family protein n=1 Tax=Castellaniella sp. TaxID=1955812 RepID=UPI003A8CEDED